MNGYCKNEHVCVRVESATFFLRLSLMAAACCRGKCSRNRRLFYRIVVVAAMLVALCMNAAALDHDESFAHGPESSTVFAGPGDAYRLEPVTVRPMKWDLPTDLLSNIALSLDVHESSKQVMTVPEILGQTVGVQVRRMGGLGSYGAASIRGSTPGQVPVYLDGVLLNAGGFASVNLGDLSLETLKSMEVYRGSVPVSLGTAGIGGAICLNTRIFVKPVTELSFSAGSWGTGRLVAMHGAKTPSGLQVLGIMSITSSMGNFIYLDRNGTLFNTDDDTFHKRLNNAHAGVGALLKVSGLNPDWKWTLAEDVYAKKQGVPGIENIPALTASLATARHALSFRARHRRVDAQEFYVDNLVLYEDFDDTAGAHGELGLGRQHTLALTGSVDAGWMKHFVNAPGHDRTVHAQVRDERFQNRELVSGVSSAPKDRTRVYLSLEDSFVMAGHTLVQAAARWEGHRLCWPGGDLPGGLGTMDPVHETRSYISPSVGMRREMKDGKLFRANLGRYVRAPDLSELFGDRGSVIGNPELSPETGINADAGISITGKTGPWKSFRADAALFGNLSSDMIVYVQNSQSTIRPENIDAARIFGMETSINAVCRSGISLNANYTYTHPVNVSPATYYDGKMLPGRPAHELYVKIRRTWRRGGQIHEVWLDLDYAAANYLDSANMKEDALARFLLGTGVRMTVPGSGWTVTLEVKNLADTITTADAYGKLRPLRDFESFPLPGRTMMLTVHRELQ